MGKIKRQKRKLHIAAVKSNTKGKSEDSASSTTGQKTEKTHLPTPANSLFQGINIDTTTLSKKLPDFDTCTVITNKSLRGLDLKKKDRQKLKHNAWMQKIENIKTTKKKDKDRSHRQKTAVVGDMRVMDDALPTLDLLMKRLHPKHGNKSEKHRPIPKEKKRKKQMMDDISIFKEVLNHPLFKDDPTGTISEHLTNKLMQEDDMDEK